MILQISTPHEAVSHQLHHTITEEPVKTETHHQKEITKPENSPGSQPSKKKQNPKTLPPFQTQRLSRWVSLFVTS